MRNLLRRLHRLLTRLRFVPRPRGSCRPFRLLPLFGVLPVALYAYAMQAVVASRAEFRERNATASAVRSMARRLAKLQTADRSTCTDYSYWDDMYQQVVHPEREWVDENLDGGVGYSFGFDICSLHDSSGAVVWHLGMDAGMRRDLLRYPVLSSCLKGGVVSGLMVLRGKVYACCASPVRKAGGKGVPSSP